MQNANEQILRLHRFCRRHAGAVKTYANIARAISENRQEMFLLFFRSIFGEIMLESRENIAVYSLDFQQLPVIGIGFYGSGMPPTKRYVRRESNIF